MGKHIEIPVGWWQCANCEVYNVPTVEECRCGCSKEFKSERQKEREYVPEKKARNKREPNKTEQEYNQWFLFTGIFEGIKLRLKNGCVYTPDWVVNRDGVLWLYEVKGIGKNGFKHPSHGRSRMAFEQAKIDWPMFKYVWAEKRNGKWKVEE